MPKLIFAWWDHFAHNAKNWQLFVFVLGRSKNSAQVLPLSFGTSLYLNFSSSLLACVPRLFGQKNLPHIHSWS